MKQVQSKRNTMHKRIIRDLLTLNKMNHECVKILMYSAAEN